MELDPAFLLQNPELVTPVAPWCVTLDNLELAILLLAQPWLAGEGLRRADLERQLLRLATELPLGPVYFQRVKRAVTRLEEAGAMAGSGAGRTRRFLVTPRGLGALILNLRVLRSDPTLDGSEFELKRTLVAMWNLVLERLGEIPGDLAMPPETARFFDEVQSLTVHGERVIDETMMADAFDILRLVETQRALVERLLDSSRERLERAESNASAVRGLDLSSLTEEGLSGAASLLAAPGALAMVRGMASGVLPRVNLRATVLRYEEFLHYLDELTNLYAGELETVPLATLRDLLARRRASG